MQYGLTYNRGLNRETHGAYDFATAILEMKPWGDMTPDEQAEIAMVIGEANETLNNHFVSEGINVNELSEEQLMDLMEEHLEMAISAHNKNVPKEVDIDEAHVRYLMNIRSTLLNGG